MNTFNALSVKLNPLSLSATAQPARASTAGVTAPVLATPNGSTAFADPAAPVARAPRRAHTPLYRAERTPVHAGERRQPTDLRAAVRLAGLAALIAVGFGLGHGGVASSSPIADAQLGVSEVSETVSARQQVVMALDSSTAR